MIDDCAAKFSGEFLRAVPGTVAQAPVPGPRRRPDRPRPARAAGALPGSARGRPAGSARASRSCAAGSGSTAWSASEVFGHLHFALGRRGSPVRVHPRRASPLSLVGLQHLRRLARGARRGIPAAHRVRARPCRPAGAVPLSLKTARGRRRGYRWPRTGVRDVAAPPGGRISSSVRGRAPRRRGRPRCDRAWWRPRSGAVTPGRCSSQASATCAGGTPRRAATSAARVHHVEVGSGAVEAVAEGVGVRPASCAARRSRSRLPASSAAGQRAPRDHADALVEAQRDHLPLLLAVEQVVVVLHGDEPRPAVPVGDVLRLGELPGEHAADAPM